MRADASEAPTGKTAGSTSRPSIAWGQNVAPRHARLLGAMNDERRSDLGAADARPVTTAVPSPEPDEPGRLRQLDVATVRELWSKTYNTDGKPDWSHIFPYYHPQLVFQDSVQRIEGLEDFQAMCGRLTRRCGKLRMDLGPIVRDGNVIFMDWKMTMTFRRTPNTPIYGSTRLVLHEDGRIVEQRDYYDLWGDIFNGIPGFRRLYRSFMHRFFG